MIDSFGTFFPLDWPIAFLTAERARCLYLEYAKRPNKRDGKPLSPNTHHWVLLIAKCWAKWCEKVGHFSSSPFAAVEPIGKGNAGKPQLRIDEALQLDRVLIEYGQRGNRAAIGILLMLHLALRQGEVSARVARDIDADGRILVIPFGKNASARRRLKIPEWLRPLLLSLLKGKQPTDLLFTDGSRIPRRQFWWERVRAFCKRGWRSAGLSAQPPGTACYAGH